MKVGKPICVKSFSRLFTFILVLSACLVGPKMSAMAQTAAAVAAPPDQDLTEIIVTGSRIAAPNEVSTSPIQVITAKQIQQGGKIDAIDLLNQLPQNFQNSVVDFSNTSSG